MGSFKGKILKSFKQLDMKVQRSRLIALNRAGKTAFTRTLDFIREGYNIKKSILREYFRISTAKKSNPVFNIYGNKKPISFYRAGGSERLFTVKQTRKGVSFRRRKTGRESIDHAFIAQMPTGHKGVFIRTGERSATGKEKIKELFAIDPAKLFVDEDAQNKLNKVFKERFELEFKRAIDAI